MAEGKLFLLKNNGALHAIDKRTGKALWKRKLGVLAASSPAYGNGRVFVTLLSRGKGKPGAVVALRAKDGKILWKRLLPSRTRVLAGVRQRPHLLRLRERHGLRAARRRRRRALDVQGLGRGQERARAGRRQALLRRLQRAACTRSARPTARQVWSTGTKGARFGLRSGRFYSTPAVAYGRVYIGNTDGKHVLVLVGQRQARVDEGHRLLRLLLARRRAGAGRQADGLLRLLRRRASTRSTRATARSRWTHRDGGKISGGATVVGDIVYFSNYGKKDTTGLGARTGRKVFHMGRGAFNPVISDGRTIFLTGYSSLYALRPRR